MKKVIICGNYGGINTGDEAMLKALVSFFSGKADLTVLSHNPEHTSKAYKVKSLHLLPMGLRSFLNYNLTGKKRKTIQAIKEADLFILGGGGLFTDEESSFAPLMWAMQAKAALKYKVPLVMLGQSVGPLRNKISRKIVFDTFQYAKKIYVRDRNSKSLLKKLGVDNFVEVELIGDLALLLKDIHSQKYFNPLTEDIIFIPRDWNGAKEKIEQVKEILKESCKGKLKTISLNRSLEHFEAGKKREACISPEKLIQTMENCKLVVSMRLHGNILASVANKPFLALSYSPKVDGFCKEMENPYVININKFDAVAFKKLLKKIEKQDKIIRKNLQIKLKVKNTDIKKALNSLLKDSS